MKKGLVTLILADGRKTRFRSAENKVLHSLLGKRMVDLVLDSLESLGPGKIYVVVGHQKEEVIRALSSRAVHFLIQAESFGTAAALLSARKLLEREKDKDVLVLEANLPLIRGATLKFLLSRHRKGGYDLTVMSVPSRSDDNSSFARIEKKGRRSSSKKLRENKPVAYLFKSKAFRECLSVASSSRGEPFDLPRLLGALEAKGRKIGFLSLPSPEEGFSVETRRDLAQAILLLQRRKNQALIARGVTILDPSSTWVDLAVRVGQDTILYPSVVLEGTTRVGRECRIFPFVHLVDMRVGDGVKILSSCMLEGSSIADRAQVGPFTHFRPKTVVRPGAKVGNFVEMKNTVFGPGSKAGHLSYIGDSYVEGGVNVGAGTITCNYDGMKKYRTIIESGVFIGSGTMLIAPLKVGKGAYIGAGSTITRNVSPGALAIARSRQVERKGWARRKLKK